MKPMTIVEACQYAPPYGGNFMRGLLSIEDAAREKGKSINLVFLFPEEARQREWVKELERNHHVYFSPRGRIRENINTIRVCRKEKADILHVHFYGMISTFLAGWFTRTKVIQHYHNMLAPGNLLRRILYRIFALRSTAQVGCSKTVMESLVSFGLPKDKCTYITNGIDFSRLDNSVNVQPFSEGKRNLLIFGSYFKIKGCDIALKAIAPIAKQRNICLNIVSVNPEKAKQAARDTLGGLPDWTAYPPPLQTL